MMKDSIRDRLAYRLLKALSHSGHLRTNDQISKEAGQDVYDTYAPGLFLGCIAEYIDYRGKAIIDIGCGTGNLSIMLAKSDARKIVGVDIDRERIVIARKKAVIAGVDNIVTFECADFVNMYHSNHLFDIAFSQDAFEHILSPLSCLQKIHDCLIPGGVLGTILGPLWLSPYGAHMQGFTSIPWVHFFFPERVVLKVRGECFRPDDLVERYEDIRGHLNRMTVKKFKEYIVQAGFVIQALRLNPSQDRGKYKLANAIVNAVPFLQELGSLQLLAVLKKPEQGP